MAKSNPQDKVIYRVYACATLAVALVLLVVGVLALWAGRYTTNMVTTELAAQKIYFPEKGSPALDPKTYPDLQQYAGQLVDTPQEARAYANGFIGHHLDEVADGKVYAEVSAEAMKDPTNEKLKKQKETLFQGETLRGMLLANGFGFGTVGQVATIVGYVAIAASAVVFGLSLIYHSRKKSA